MSDNSSASKDRAWSTPGLPMGSLAMLAKKAGNSYLYGKRVWQASIAQRPSTQYQLQPEHSNHPQFIFYISRSLLPHLIHVPSLLALQLSGTNSLLRPRIYN